MIDPEVYSSDNPIDNESLQLYLRVNDRLDHVCKILEDYRPLFKHWSREHAEVQSNNVYCKFKFNDDEFPTVYLELSDSQIKTREQVLKDARDAKERQEKEAKAEVDRQSKIRQYHQLGVELGLK